MEKKKVVPVWVSMILLALCAGGAAVSGYWAISLMNQFTVAAGFHILMVLTDLTAIAYCVAGYKKNAAVFFKLVCVFLALSAAYSVVDVIVYYDTHILNLVITVLLLIVRLCFVFAKDLGKKKSFILAFTVLALMLIMFFNIISRYSSIWVSTLLRIVVDIVFFIMVYAKYQDKAARGTK